MANADDEPRGGYGNPRVALELHERILQDRDTANQDWEWWLKGYITCLHATAGNFDGKQLSTLDSAPAKKPPGRAAA